MTVFDVLNLYQTPFEWMLDSGIHIEDVSYVGLYKEYIRMKKEGCKMTYIVVCLAEKYRISERKVYTLLKRLSQNCEPLERRVYARSLQQGKEAFGHSFSVERYLYEEKYTS